jgi:sugar/nucleoside kinase (ribokinase family)
MSIVVVGSIALDTIKTPEKTVEEVLGGSASYFALSARHFTEVQVVAVVGEDFPSDQRDLLISCGVDTEGLTREAGRTFRWAGEYGVDLAYPETLATELNVFASFHPQLTEKQRRADTVFLANIDPALQLEVLDQVESPRVVACDTMNLWIETKRETLLDLVRRVDVLLINDEEARQLAGESQLPRAARKILELGVRQMIIKKGEHGALFYSSDERYFCPAFPQENLVDPTGAGDSFAGGLLGYLDHVGPGETLPLRAAMVCGTAMASLCVESFSPRRLAETHRTEIAGRIEAIRDLTRVPEVPLWQSG